MGAGGPGRGPAPRNLSNDQREAVDHVQGLRQVCRWALTTLDDESQRHEVLMRLYTKAKQGPVPAIAAGVLVEEVVEYALHVGEVPAPIDRTMAAIQKLHRSGYSRCPRCLLPLPTGADLHYWRELGHKAIDAAVIREQAPYRSTNEEDR